MTAMQQPGLSLDVSEEPSAPADLVIVENGAPVEPPSPVEDLAIVEEATVATQLPTPGVEGFDRFKVAGPGRPTARLTRFLVACVDAVAVATSMVTSYALVGPSDMAGGDWNAYQRMSMVALPLWILVFCRYRLYDARHVTSRREEVGRVVHAVGVSTLVTALVGYFLHLQVERSRFLLLFVAAVATVLVAREVLRYGFGTMRRRGRCLRRVAIAGTGAEALAMVRAFEERPELGYGVVALVGDPGRVAPSLSGYPVAQLDNDLIEGLRSAGAAGVIVATTDVDLELSNRLIRMLTDAGMHVELSSSLRDIDVTRLSVQPLGRFSMLYVEPVKRDGWRAVAKRVFDLGFAVIGLVVSLPLLALAALAIKLTSPGPVLFRQERVGRGGRTFELYKLRTMVRDADALLRRLELQDEADGPLFKIRRDPRVMPVGRFLRRFSIDELPQLFNVIKGEMSLVGPRPALPHEVTGWTAELGERLRVQPGITGMWQVSGRSNSSFADYQRWDLYYVYNWSLWRDLSILLRTVPAVLFSRGAY